MLSNMVIDNITHESGVNIISNKLIKAVNMLKNGLDRIDIESYILLVAHDIINGKLSMNEGISLLTASQSKWDEYLKTKGL